MTYRFLSIQRLPSTGGPFVVVARFGTKIGKPCIGACCLKCCFQVILAKLCEGCSKWGRPEEDLSSWRSPLGAKIGCPCSSCLKTHYKSDTLDPECVEMHYKVVSCFLESLKTHYEVHASFANVHEHILKLRDTARVQRWLVRWLLFYSVSARRKYDLM